MRMKVERIAEGIAAICSSWPGVEAVSLGELSDADTLDPYFVLSFDVFHTGSLPDREERRRLFEGSGAFETSRFQTKDRFLVDGLPVRIEYKLLEDIEALFALGERDFARLMGVGTYPFHRIETGRLLHDRTGWFAAIRARLQSLPDSMWAGLREVFEARMEHYLTDLGAAARMEDSFFYLESTAGFARHAEAVIFAVNRTFEPSHRSIEARLRSLDHVPADFFGRWEVFLRTDIDMSREQKYEIAKLLAKSILALT
jgi:hypothetical protein